jgi:hypothetical protein
LHVGIKPITESRPLPGQIEPYLPHGCYHLFSKGVLASPTGVSFSGVGLTFDGPIKAISDLIKFYARINNNSVPPVMSNFELENYELRSKFHKKSKGTLVKFIRRS